MSGLGARDPLGAPLDPTSCTQMSVWMCVCVGVCVCVGFCWVWRHLLKLQGAQDTTQALKIQISRTNFHRTYLTELSVQNATAPPTQKTST